MRKHSLKVSVLFAVCLLLVHSARTYACPACYGAADSAETQGLNWAILSLLGFTGSVLAGLSTLFWYLRKRTMEFNRRFSGRLN